jgi:hypothetical protein
MKLISIFALFSLIAIHLNGQAVTGKVIDSSSGEPLEYVSIGVVNTSIGIITDSKGNFKIDVKGQSPKAVVRISMISYAPQIFTIEELSAKENIIKLVSTPMQLAEVIVRPSGKSREVGTTSYTRIGGWCGWGGSNFGQGNEIGTKIELGNLPVQINKLHVHVQRQAFDSSLYRLHIRTIVDNSPFEELLNTNIILAITKESGWIDFDLSKYNIILKGDVALTLEWVKVIGINKKRAQKIDKIITTEYVLFNTKKNQGNIYTRWGTEAKWTMHENGSPSIYLTIQ